MPHRNIRDDLPVDVRLALLEEGMEDLRERFDTLFRAIVTLIGTLLGGMLLFLFSVSAGWLGGG